MSGILTRMKFIPVVVGAAALSLGATVSLGSDHADDEDELEFEEANIYFELNDTDGDLGIHGLIDGDAWKSLRIEDPNERVLLAAWIRGKLRRQGMTEFFFESAEPTFDELSPSKFFARFPEGTYEVEGVTLDGKEIEGEAEVSHVMAAAPGNIRVNGQPAAENCDADDLPTASGAVTLNWNSVKMSHPEIGTPGVPVRVEQYEVVAEIEREGRTPEVLIFSATLPRWVTRFQIPPHFTRLAKDEMKFEIITKLDNGNQTAVESCFEIG